MSTTPRNPGFEAALATAPGTIADFRAQASAMGQRDAPLDLGVGDPRVPVTAAMRTALAEGVPDVSQYPLAAGTDETREAVARWVARRHHVDVDPSSDVVPTHGSKEAIASLTQLVVARASAPGTRGTVVVTSPGYPTPAHAARLVGAEVLTLDLRPSGAFLPDLDSIDAATWARVALLWLNYPNNPTTAVAPLDLYEQAAELARRHGFIVASDEAYAEVYDSDPPPSALEVPDRSHVVVFTSLSKRSGLTAFRCGAAIGPGELIADLKRLRAMLGLAPQVFTQHLAAAAWDDDEAAAELRLSLMSRANVLLDAVRDAGVEAYGGDASPFVWLRVPDGGSDTALCRRLVEAGVLATPGSFFGDAGAGFVRLAAMAPADECERAAALLRDVL